MMPTTILMPAATCLRLATRCRRQTRRLLSNAARDSRVAGRRRFYLDVGVQEVPAPWQMTSSSSSSSSATVDSGIAAGVDGTQSASGVSSRLEMNAQVLKQALVPRRPTIGLLADQDNDNGTTRNYAAPFHNNNNTTTIPWHTVTLDGRGLRTPMGQALAVPSQLLATALAAEWNAVANTVNPTQMPLMTLVCTVLDQVAQPAVGAAIQDDCMNYLSTDTLCYFADPLQDRVLYRRQDEHWHPVHEFVAKRLLPEANSTNSAASAAAIIHGAQEAILSATQSRLPHPAALTENCRALLSRLDAWHLQCLYSVCRESKSLLLGLAVLLDHYDDDDNANSLQAAVEAARVEEEFQISCWGLVEGGHDYDRLNCAVQIQAAGVLKDCLAIDCLGRDD